MPLLRMLNKVFAFISSLIFISVFYSSAAFSAEYYTIRETVRGHEQASIHPSIHPSLDPWAALDSVVAVAAEQFLNLMEWQPHSQKLQDPAEPYSRLTQYGTWVTDPEDGTCLNTRARVLVRQSSVSVTLSPKGCTVISGKWLDPYSNRNYSQASDLDIDHMVPLKNSYISGAWKWDFKKRCLYANFMHNDFHLIAVKDDDNKKKGESSPEKFMPSDPAYRCEYLANWLKIKLIWDLAMTSSEGQAIEALAQENNCDVNSMSMRLRDLRSQRRSIVSNLSLCDQ